LLERFGSLIGYHFTSVVVLLILTAGAVNAQAMGSPNTAEASISTNPDSRQAVVSDPLKIGTDTACQRSRQEERTDQLMQDLNQPSTGNVMDKLQQGKNRQTVKSTSPK
jgi:hypothetical protein